MPRPSLPQTLLLGTLLGILTLAVPVPEASAQPGYRYSQGGKQDSARQQKPQGKRSGQYESTRDGKRDGKRGDSGGQGMSAQQAAAEAQARYGGRVLKVSPSGSGYRVRLLQDDGRVINVSIGD